MTESLTVDRMSAVPMRDGVVLRADVYRPVGQRCPALVFRTPYDRTGLGMYGTFALRAASEGYAVVMQDTRGRGASGGRFTPFVHERDDGYDTVDWVVSQPWCDGNVGMFGGSYDGVTQWQGAMSGHPALRAIAPNVTASSYHHGWVYRGGAFQLSFSLGWTLSLAAHNAARDPSVPASVRGALTDALDRLPDTTRVLPLDDHPYLDEVAPYYREWLRHPDYDEFWERLDVSRAYPDMTVAAFNMGGWYDTFLGGTLANFAGMRARSAVPDRQRLLVGPWPHEGLFSGNPVGEWNFGARATGSALDVDGLQLRWFDRWLRGDDAAEADPPVLLYAMGGGGWRVADSWPLPGTEHQDWYLHSDGRANTLHGDGRLSRETPGAQPPDAFVYNPRNPVPTLGGALCCSPVHTRGGVYDQRPVEAREDVLVYTSEPLTEPLDVTGPVTAVLHAATTAVDTDWTAKLVDVEPCGYARNLTDGVLRARHRAPGAGPLTPGEVVEYRIDLGATSNVFQPGHRVRLEVSSSNFPHFDRNPNTGGVGEPVSAMQSVHHSGAHLSRVVLPVVPSEATRPHRTEK
ncbi:CocE/NonD family hydrolase [Saccharothrix obliqua]|uniref:CocE/NonD family hydrolase n=1 Tax=Saccharothrix obliqua TaxID=2861747 RepID=UPI001C5F4513|nr:CocE/NonD family hydrolase [Saccharothrix obliqua]MBW4720442.1 CocE/NonD family hydrolase [Saccharothrix obliqua]